ncbi:MAG: NAD(P)H-dependent oxidoreductase, partial [Spirochaetaceae bacterium]|nr:NAD(P)H-dependent oxidoreductase [Spirochaetaceae bacterium]
RLEFAQCRACGACQRGATGRCAVAAEAGGDGVETVFEALRAADIVVYGTPVYVFSPSSLLKSLVERFYELGRESSLLVTESGLLFHEVERAVAGKPFAAVIDCDNVEREATINSERWFRSMSRFLDAPLVGMLVRNGGRLIRAGKAAVTQAQVTDAFRRAGRELARDGRISAGTRKAASRNALPISRSLFALMKLSGRGSEALAARASG